MDSAITNIKGAQAANGWSGDISGID